MLIAIVAHGINNEIGFDSNLLWHLPKDFKMFKEKTSGHNIIMGRKTFESFPKPLPNRKHIILSKSSREITNDECVVVNNITEALDMLSEQDIHYIIGGGEIYQQFLDMNIVDMLLITKVHSTFDEANVFFPIIDENKWMKITSENHYKDEKHKYDFTFETYIKQK